jgi:hypothetical protein
MRNSDQIRIIHYDADHVYDDRPGRKPTTKRFYEIRDSVVATCMRHGLTGPECGVDEGHVYWVVDDQYNDERYQYLEICKPAGMTKSWLLDLMATLEKHPQWGVGISIPYAGYMLVFSDRVMVSPGFRGVEALDDVIERAVRALELVQMIREATDDEGLERLIQVAGIEREKIAFVHLEGVTDRGLIHISRLVGTTSVVLDSSRITDHGLFHLRTLTNLEELWLQKTRITGRGLIHLRGLPRLKEIFLGLCKLSDEGIEHLGKLKYLEQLDLTRVPITDDGVVHLKDLRGLKNLRLFGCHVSDKGLCHLRGLQSLEELDLEGTCVTNSGLVHLEQLSRLTRLNLKGTGVTAKGAKRFQKLFPECEVDTGLSTFPPFQ